MQVKSRAVEDHIHQFVSHIKAVVQHLGLFIEDVLK